MDNNKIFGYSVIKQLGKGSFGEVVLAHKASDKIAIKKISKKQIIKVPYPMT
jgi:serine/threonine protein kinase